MIARGIMRSDVLPLLSNFEIADERLKLSTFTPRSRRLATYGQVGLAMSCTPQKAGPIPSPAVPQSPGGLTTPRKDRTSGRLRYRRACALSSVSVCWLISRGDESRDLLLWSTLVDFTLLDRAGLVDVQPDQ